MVNEEIVVDEKRTREIGNRIKQCRKRTSITLQEMADYVGLSLYLLIQKYWISILKLFILQILSFISR